MAEGVTPVWRRCGECHGRDGDEQEHSDDGHFELTVSPTVPMNKKTGRRSPRPAVLAGQRTAAVDHNIWHMSARESLHTVILHAPVARDSLPMSRLPSPRQILVKGPNDATVHRE